jgi:hypothetical protein
MKYRILLSLLFLSVGLALYAQTNPQNVFTSGTITASGTSCATAGACVPAVLPLNTASVSVTISNTFSGTLQFEDSVDGVAPPGSVTCFPPNSTTGVTSVTGTGNWICSVASQGVFDVRASALASGTPLVKIGISNALSASSLGAGGAPSGTAGGDLGGTYPNPTVQKITGAAPFSTGSSTGNTLTGPREYFVCTAACTVTPPVPVAGYEFCILNDDNVSSAITLGAIGSSARYENTARTAYGTAGTGTFTSGGAVGDKVCLVGRDTTHYLTVSFNGTWTAS